MTLLTKWIDCLKGIMMSEFELNKSRTARGFKLIEFKDSYGQECSLQKSSAAFEDYVWLGIDDATPQIMAVHGIEYGLSRPGDVGWVTFPIPNEVLLTTRMHLNREQARVLAAELIKFADSGDLDI